MNVLYVSEGSYYNLWDAYETYAEAEAVAKELGLLYIIRYEEE
jgi:hypothetical protein